MFFCMILEIVAYYNSNVLLFKNFSALIIAITIQVFFIILFIYLWDRIFIAEDCSKLCYMLRWFLICYFLPPHPMHWGGRHAPPCPVLCVLGSEPRALCILEKQSSSELHHQFPPSHLFFSDITPASRPVPPSHIFFIDHHSSIQIIHLCPNFGSHP